MRPLAADEDQRRPIDGPGPTNGPGRHPGVLEVAQVMLVEIPGDGRGRVEQVFHRAGPAQELVAPLGIVVRGPQNHQIRAAGVGVVPGQPASVQPAGSQRGLQPRVIRVASGVRGTTRQDEAGMEDVRSGELHARA